ncbi:Potassium voltage-gated channel protein Shaw [Lamellibrachia satsuma]|nr:Potassium voltage-gated channel protein Shaw [Lamellibrachia satsuma]
MLPLRRNRSLQGGQLQLDNWEVEMADIRDKLLGPSANSCCNAASEGTALSLNGPHIVDAGQVEATMMASDESVNKLPLKRTASSEIVRINVGGTVFTTRRATIERIPETRLANLRKTDPNFDQATGEWFFDRNPALFGNVLDYLRTDELHFPHNFCGPSIKNELTYWNLDESCISPCCWNRYREFEEDKKIFQHIEDAFESQTLNECMIPEGADISQLSRWHVWRRRIFVFLEEPMSSRYAKVCHLVLFILRYLLNVYT